MIFLIKCNESIPQFSMTYGKFSKTPRAIHHSGLLLYLKYVASILRIFSARQKYLIFNCPCSCIQSTNWRGFSRQGKHANPNVFCPDNPLYRLLYQSNWHIAIFHLRCESGIREHTKTSSSLTRAISVYLFIMQYIFNTVLLII